MVLPSCEEPREVIVPDAMFSSGEQLPQKMASINAIIQKSFIKAVHMIANMPVKDLGGSSTVPGAIDLSDAMNFDMKNAHLKNHPTKNIAGELKYKVTAVANPCGCLILHDWL